MFNLFKKKSAALPKWTFSKAGFVWRVMFIETGRETAANTRIIGEHRTSSETSGEKKASFFCLDDDTGGLLWDDFTLTGADGKPVGDGWWVGLETTHAHLFYLHGYFDATVPEHLGIWAIDSAGKQPVWQQPKLAFVSIVQGGKSGAEKKMLAYSDDLVEGYAERHYFLLDPLTGAVEKDLGRESDEVNALRDDAYQASLAAEVVLPTHIDTASPPFAPLKPLAEKYSPSVRVIGGYDLITTETMVLLGYHEQTDTLMTTPTGNTVKALTYTLKGIEKSSGAVLMSETLATGMSGMMLDGFFTRAHRLYFVRDRSTLVVYELS